MPPTQPIAPSETPSMATKPANTFSAMWPASMLANRRRLCETGFTKKNDRISMNMTSGRTKIGTPDGTNILKNFRPFLYTP